MRPGYVLSVLQENLNDRYLNIRFVHGQVEIDVVCTHLLTYPVPPGSRDPDLGGIVKELGIFDLIPVSFQQEVLEGVIQQMDVKPACFRESKASPSKAKY